MERIPRILTDSNVPYREGAALYQMKQCGHCQMMGYILRSSEGRIFLIDGGTYKEYEEFIRLARRVADCREGEPLRVSGWFLTHHHHDHVGVFLTAAENKFEGLKIDRVYCNPPTRSYVSTFEDDDRFDAFDRLERCLNKHEDLVRRIGKGFRAEWKGIAFQALTEPDEGVFENTGNNSSSVLRVETEGQRHLFLGDFGAERSDGLIAEYGEEGLRSTLVQMAHHGQNGVKMSVYAAAQPIGCLWPTPKWLWDNDAGGGYGTGPWETLATRDFIEKLGVKYNFVEKDGIWEIPLPFSPNKV